MTVLRLIEGNPLL